MLVCVVYNSSYIDEVVAAEFDMVRAPKCGLSMNGNAIFFGLERALLFW